MLNHADIYQYQVDSYDDMVAKQPCFMAQLASICDPQGKTVLDLGAGTGRLSVKLAETAQALICTDQSTEMLGVLERKLRSLNSACTWHAIQADHRNLPLQSQSVDLITAGWSISYLVNEDQEDWMAHLEQIMEQLRSVLKPGGSVIILETLGTGTRMPAPPANLLRYYEALETKYGFRHSWFRGDYHFGNWQDADKGMYFFFGEALSAMIRKHQWAVVPECVGMWWYQSA